MQLWAGIVLLLSGNVSIGLRRMLPECKQPATSQNSLPSWSQRHASSKFHFWYFWGQNSDGYARPFVTVFRLLGFMIPTFPVHWPLILPVYLWALQRYSPRVKVSIMTSRDTWAGSVPQTVKRQAQVSLKFSLTHFQFSLVILTLALPFSKISFPSPFSALAQSLLLLCSQHLRDFTSQGLYTADTLQFYLQC